ncbi:OLC1v1019248C1 [Oldenlandia corymbosa var. corymbosa]|uniref:OLC1v1019248C1 n=1 Tax=Oldenlandia corymbosa var. corymbosa TaxID=529605 RepID=A0AAV1EDW8_OLDCO|nr:OLC1v1019248C1 [Oldenlandia corymbosa var. corymbosa]
METLLGTTSFSSGFRRNSSTAPLPLFEVEIYTVGRRHIFKDSLVGPTRCLVSNLFGNIITPVHTHRPSGNFDGILNVAASLGADSGMFGGSSAVSFHELLDKTKTQVEAEEGNKSLFQRLRVVRSSPSLFPMSAKTTPLNEPKEAATMGTVKSDSALPSMLDYEPEQL